MLLRQKLRKGSVRRRATVLLLLVAIVAAAAVAAILITMSVSAPGRQLDGNGVARGPVTASEINSQADAHLIYPGAVVLHTDVIAESTPSAAGGRSDEPARVTTFIATTATPVQVRSWYEVTLGSQGYECYRLGEPAYDYAMDTYVRHDREFVWVGYVKPQLLRLYYAFPIPQDRTVIELNYLIRPRGVTSVTGADFGGPADVCYEPLATPAPPN